MKKEMKKIKSISLIAILMLFSANCTLAVAKQTKEQKVRKEAHEKVVTSAISLYSGNFDLNRFKSEIVAPLLKGEPFEYGIFDCGMQKITKTVKVSDLDFIVVEGSYSQHEDLGEYADIKLFFDISNEEQQKRILARNGINAKQGFDNIWIPAEERYFERYSIKEKANIIVTTEV